MAKARHGRPNAGRSKVDRRVPTGAVRQYPRVARVNEVLRQVLAEAIERMADTDDRLALLTVTAVTADPDFARASVLFAALNDDARSALADARPRLQALIASQVRLKRTPQLAFTIDPAVATGSRIEEILRLIRHDEAPEVHEGDPDGD